MIYNISLNIFILNFLSLDPFQWSSLSDGTVEDNHYTLQPGPELTNNPSPLQISSSYSLADLLAFYGRQQPPSNPALTEASQPATVLGKRDVSPAAADWPVPSKKKRNFSLGVAGKCCNQGCTKNDIGRLCWGREESAGRRDGWRTVYCCGKMWGVKYKGE